MFLHMGWTETLSKRAHRSRVLAGVAAGALVLWERVLKSQREGNMETQPAAALALHERSDLEHMEVGSVTTSLFSIWELLVAFGRGKS